MQAGTLWKVLIFLGIYVLILFSDKHVFGQGSIRNARQMGMGRTSVALFDGHWHLFGNPAFMVGRNHRYTVQFNGLRHYGLSDLQEISGAATLRQSFGTAGAGIHRFGNELYRELKAVVGYSNRWKSLLMGGTLRYEHIGIAEYGSAGTVGLHLGSAIQIGEGIWLGAVANNVNRPEMGVSREELPQTMGFGLGWRIGDRATITTEIIKELGFPVSWRGGIEMRVAGPLLARIGTLTRPTAWTAGVGLELEGLAVDFGLEHHQVLGMSYGVGMGIY